jgi:hypothetical protein
MSLMCDVLTSGVLWKANTKSFLNSGSEIDSAIKWKI